MKLELFCNIMKQHYMKALKYETKHNKACWIENIVRMGRLNKDIKIERFVLIIIDIFL